jgi:AAA+ ATPase superfamily predicted ATPase
MKPRNTRTFSGRKEELEILDGIKRRGKTSIVVVMGRRRIGKSALIYEFSHSFKHYWEFQGAAPRKDSTNESQLLNFAEQLQKNFGGAQPLLNNWTEAFSELAKEIRSRPCLIMLDELSWMGKYDPDFAGKLKIAWDTLFSRIPNLILVLCGSVSSWIEENILKSTDFVGRVSHTLRITELDLKNVLTFWGANSSKVSLRDRLTYACISGGVPKYLEEFDLKETISANVKKLCFTAGGYLFDDFEKIFSDIFGNRQQIYKKIVETIISKHLTPQELAEKLGISYGGDITNYITDLESSGFISRDYHFKPGGNKGRHSRLRISDNYLRFYLKHISPNKEKINRNIFGFKHLSDLPGWHSIIGLQFENLILNHLPEMIQLLGLQNERILSAGAYFQSATTKSQACQIDLLIECKPNNFYIAEIKIQDEISAKIITEVQHKLDLIKLPRYSSRRPVLIYFGNLSPDVEDADFFDKILDIGKSF